MKTQQEIGALQSVFPCSESKILDHMLVMKDFDYSISDISRISGVGFKTAMEIIHKLEKQDVFVFIRNVGRSQMYQFNSKSLQGRYIEKLAFEIAKKRNLKLVKKIKS